MFIYSSIFKLIYVIIGQDRPIDKKENELMYSLFIFIIMGGDIFIVSQQALAPLAFSKPLFIFQHHMVIKAPIGTTEL